MFVGQINNSRNSDIYLVELVILHLMPMSFVCIFISNLPLSDLQIFALFGAMSYVQTSLEMAILKIVDDFQLFYTKRC